jgi:hypothetical protein
MESAIYRNVSLDALNLSSIWAAGSWRLRSELIRVSQTTVAVTAQNHGI